MSQNNMQKHTGLTLLRVLVVAVTAVALGLGGSIAWTASQSQAQPQSQPRVASDPATPGQFVGITPVRVLDTRIPIGVATKAKMGPGEIINVPVTGVGGIPSDATAVNISITSEGASELSYFTVYPTGSSTPHTSTANISPGLSLAGSGTFDLGTSGELAVFNAFGSVDAVMDVNGYYVAAPTVQPVLTTDAAHYAGGATVTFNGSLWPAACTSINVDVFGPGGSTVATGLTATAGAFSGTFPAPTGTSLYFLIAHSHALPICQAFTTFSVP